MKIRKRYDEVNGEGLEGEINDYKRCGLLVVTTDFISIGAKTQTRIF